MLLTGCAQTPALLPSSSTESVPPQPPYKGLLLSEASGASSPVVPDPAAPAPLPRELEALLAKKSYSAAAKQLVRDGSERQRIHRVYGQ